MTWKEVKLATLQKLYAWNSDGSLEDELNNEYLEAMAQAANEATLALWNARQPRRLMPVALNGHGVELERVLPGYKDDCGTLPRVMAHTEDHCLVRLEGAIFSAGFLLPRPEWPEVVMVEYEPEPEMLTVDTPDDHVLECGDMRAVLLPLYMAGMLYKAVDPRLAAQYMNEFEAARDALAARSSALAVAADGCLGFDR